MVAKNAFFRKDLLETLLIPAIVVLVGLTAFGLGRLSALQAQKGELKVYGEGGAQAAPAALGAAVAASAPKTHAVVGEGLPAGQAGKYVASKHGTRYYLPSCSGAKRINEENKIWFGSAEAAQGAGFTPAANCPGL